MALPTILHVDLDAFFAAVEQRDRPELRGKPVIVGGGAPTARGVVSAASYEARRYGVHSAMPLRTAYALCPQGVFLPVDGRKYQRVSREVMTILRRFTPLVEPISIDEAFLDVTASRALFGDGPTIAAAIKAAIVAEVGLTASVGVATTKLVAKVASDLRKPDGLVVVPAGEEAAFLAPLPIARLWGVGEKTAAALGEFGVTTIGDLTQIPEEILARRFGKHGGSLGARARGIDPDPVGGGDPAKSIGHEHTFDVDTSDPELIERTLLAMADGVASRLRSAGFKAGTVTVKIRDSSFRTITRQRTLADPTDLAEPIWRIALELARPEVRGLKVRLLGVTASHLGEREQLGLFDAGLDAGTGERAPAQGDPGCRCDPAAVRGSRGHPGAPPGSRSACPVRARPDEAARTTDGDAGGRGAVGRRGRLGREVGHSAVMRVVASRRRAGGRVVRRVDDDSAEDPGQAGQVRDAGRRPAPILEARDGGLRYRAQRLQPPLGKAARSAGQEESATDAPEVVVDVSGSVAWDRHRPIQLGPTSRGINCPLRGRPDRERVTMRRESPTPVIEGSSPAGKAGWRCHNAHHRETARRWPRTPDAASAPWRSWSAVPQPGAHDRERLVTPELSRASSSLRPRA